MPKYYVNYLESVITDKLPVDKLYSFFETPKTNPKHDFENVVDKSLAYESYDYKPIDM